MHNSFSESTVLSILSISRAINNYDSNFDITIEEFAERATKISSLFITNLYSQLSTACRSENDQFNKNFP